MLTGQPKLNPPTPEARAITYRVVPPGYDDFVNADKHVWTLEVHDGGSEHGWAVRRVGGLWELKADFEWSYAPQPSDRTEAYLKAHRWPLEQALERAMIAVQGLVLNGCTAKQASDHVAARMKSSKAPQRKKRSA